MRNTRTLCKDIIVNNYKIIQTLGKGAFSIVYLAQNLANNNFYALK